MAGAKRRVWETAKSVNDNDDNDDDNDKDKQHF